MNSIYKDFTAGDIFWDMGFAASDMAYKALTNTNLSPEEQIKWYAILQTLGNNAIVNWKYYAGKVLEESDKNTIIGNIILGGFDAAATAGTMYENTNSVYASLGYTAAKAILNKNVTTAVWSVVNHGWKSIFSDVADETDALASKYLERTAYYSLIINGNYERMLKNKVPMNILKNSFYVKDSDGNRYMSLYLKANEKLSRAEIRLLGQNSKAYSEDILNHENTQLPSIQIGKDGKAHTTHEYDKHGFPVDVSEDLWITFKLKPDVERIEILGWKYNQDSKTIPYMEIHNINESKEIPNYYNNITDELIKKIQNASLFNQGFETVEYLAASILDMDWHTITNPVTVGTNEFERNSMKKINLIPEILPRYRSTYFNHIFSGGYSSGYYGYIWSAVLDADAFNAFVESGNIFNKKIAARYRKYILSAGNTDDLMTLYKKFRGKAPSIEPLLKRRGLDN